MKPDEGRSLSISIGRRRRHGEGRHGGTIDILSPYRHEPTIFNRARPISPMGMLVRPISQPLFAFDPGWLFLLAGLVMCAAVVVLPANEDVEALELELAILQREESTVYQRLGANAAFLEAVDSRDSRLLRRLAAGQLNLVPESAVPVLMSTSASEPVRHWIEAPLLGTGSGGTEVRERSHLERWSAGDHRLWILGAGTLAIFYGLLPRLIAGRAEA